MNINLPKIFTNKARTRILYVLYFYEEALSINALARLTGFSPIAVSKALLTLKQENLVIKERTTKSHYFTLNKNSESYQLLDSVFKAEDSVRFSSFHSSIQNKLDQLFTLMEKSFVIKYPKLKKLSFESQFEDIVKTLSEDSEIAIEGLLPAACYRKNVRAITEINLIVSHFPKEIKLNEKYFPHCKAVVLKGDQSIKLQVIYKEQALLTFNILRREQEKKYLTVDFKGIQLKFQAVEDLIADMLYSYLNIRKDLLIIDDLQEIIDNIGIINLVRLKFALKRYGLDDSKYLIFKQAAKADTLSLNFSAFNIK